MAENPQYESVLVAEFLLAIAHEKKAILNMTKVQKMVYALYVYYLATKNRRLFLECPRAWPSGPVFPNIKTNVNYSYMYKKEDERFAELNKEEELIKDMNSVLDACAGFSGRVLCDWSHMEGAPWKKATQRKGFKWGDMIDENDIKQFFSQLEI